MQGVPPLLTRRLVIALASAPILLMSLPATSEAADAPGLTSAGSPLAGATVRTGAAVTATGAGTVQVKWVLDGTYVGADSTAPFTWTASGSTGPHVLRARLYDASGVQTRLQESFSLQSGDSPVTGPGVVAVRDTTALVEALSTARPGTVIELADGTYSSGRAFSIQTACTAAAPCVLRGGRGAVLSGGGTSGAYGLHLVKASHWTVSGLTVAGAAKGVVLDSSSGNVLSGLDVHDIGEEGIHLRSASSDNVVRDSLVHDTGKRRPEYGEGVYVGSATSNWATYSGGVADRSDRNLITGNKIRNTGAESVDIKEGTTGGTLSGNTFDGTGMSGANYADSWVDVKGNGWLVSANRGVNALLDGFQTHVAVTGWGERNVFRGNVADTRSAGYGFRIDKPTTTGTTVACDNTAATARSGLSNLACR